MARRKHQKELYKIMAFASLGLLVLGAIGVFLTNVEWGSVTGVVLGVILAGFGVYSVIHFFQVARYQYLKAKRLAAIQRIKSTLQMNHMSPTEFEHYVGALYENLGYSAAVTKQSGDGGIDVVLRNSEGTAGVQVKRYRDTMVGRPEVQKLVGACAKKYDKMIFVTSSDFTNEAVAYAAEHGVVLINGGSLEAMAKKLSTKDPIQESFAFKFHHRMKSR
jgi:HJR/Mrr/RecB family endonuclease